MMVCGRDANYETSCDDVEVSCKRSLEMRIETWDD